LFCSVLLKKKKKKKRHHGQLVGPLVSFHPVKPEMPGGQGGMGREAKPQAVSHWKDEVILVTL